MAGAVWPAMSSAPCSRRPGQRSPSYEAPAVKRELSRDRSKAELRVIGTGIAHPSSYPVGSTDPNHDPGHPGGAAPRWRHHSE
jgi:hypothetical protein